MADAAERALKAGFPGKNFVFAGSDAGGEILAEAMTGIEPAKLSGLNPEAYLADFLGRIRTHDPRRLDELLPWNWEAGRDTTRTPPEERCRAASYGDVSFTSRIQLVMSLVACRPARPDPVGLARPACAAPMPARASASARVGLSW